MEIRSFDDLYLFSFVRKLITQITFLCSNHQFQNQVYLSNEWVLYPFNGCQLASSFGITIQTIYTIIMIKLKSYIQPQFVTCPFSHSDIMQTKFNQCTQITDFLICNFDGIHDMLCILITIMPLCSQEQNFCFHLTYKVYLSSNHPQIDIAHWRGAN